MNELPVVSDSDALTRIIQILEPVRPEARIRVLLALMAFYGQSNAQTESWTPAPLSSGEPNPTTGSGSNSNTFSEDRAPTVKSFLFEKKPTTDVEKVACLAYYLAHYRETQDFKTVDISVINTEAGQIKFSNATYAINNAEKSGLLIPSSRGQKRISALGEVYVQALPDKAAAREAIAHARSRKRRTDAKKKANQ